MCLGHRENDDNGSSSPPPLLAKAQALWHKLWPKKIVAIIDWISLTLELNVDISPWQMGPSNQTKLEFQDSLSLARCKTKTLPVRNWVAWSRYVSHLSSFNADKATIWETAATLLIAVLLNPFFIPCLPFPSVILQTMTNENMPLFVWQSDYVIQKFP